MKESGIDKLWIKEVVQSTQIMLKASLRRKRVAKVKRELAFHKSKKPL